MTVPIDASRAYMASHRRTEAAIARLQAAIDTAHAGMFVTDAPEGGDAAALAHVADAIEDAEADFTGETIVYRVQEDGFTLSTWHDEDEAEVEANHLNENGREAIVVCCSVGTGASE